LSLFYRDPVLPGPALREIAGEVAGGREGPMKSPGGCVGSCSGSDGAVSARSRFAHPGFQRQKKWSPLAVQLATRLSLLHEDFRTVLAAKGSLRRPTTARL